MPFRPSPTRSSALLARAAHDGARLAVGVLPLDVGALVVGLLALREAELDLHLPALEVEAERDERHAFARDGALDAIDLVLLRECLSRTARLVRERVRHREGRDVELLQPELAVLHRGERVDDLDLLIAHRLHLAADEHETALELLLDVIV